MKIGNNKGNVIVWVTIIIAIIWGLFALFSNDESSSSYESVTDSPTVENQYYGNEYAEEPQSFNGYECTDDCSGHEAGYNWAEENGIEDEGDCGGNSNSFIEGCQSYVEENY
jgi:hypothetical protein